MSSDDGLDFRVFKAADDEKKCSILQSIHFERSFVRDGTNLGTRFVVVTLYGLNPRTFVVPSTLGAPISGFTKEHGRLSPQEAHDKVMSDFINAYQRAMIDEQKPVEAKAPIKYKEDAHSPDSVPQWDLYHDELIPRGYSLD